MSLGFLEIPDRSSEGALARSPMAAGARAAGARFEVRAGWEVAVGYPGPERPPVGWADVSHLRKLELQGTADALTAAGAPLAIGPVARTDGAWWCRLTPTRALVIGGAPGDDPAPGVDVVDMTSVYAALTLIGPQARETFARFCALDLRPESTPVRCVRPGSVARQPGLILREAEERYLCLFGWALGEYMWTVVQDAGRHLGDGPIGLDALPELPDA